MALIATLICIEVDRLKQKHWSSTYDVVYTPSGLTTTGPFGRLVSFLRGDSKVIASKHPVLSSSIIFTSNSRKMQPKKTRLTKAYMG